ncbi:Gfo/Idh/MocA family oxidoreductase [Candidatus Sumerlaeota bacterium]|nr:Gfo/Idh/MocA family oxidoreductase [Candidatus Sumerlaeota bacterium]
MNAAIFGAGLMGGVHAASLASIPDVKLKWIVDQNKTRGKELASTYGARWTSDADAAIRDSETEIVIHALPTPTRAPFLKRYLREGKHIFCEKPLARNQSEAKEILQCIKGYDHVFMVGHVVRFFWEYVQARQMVLKGDIGKPGIVRVSRCGGAPASRDKKDNWYLDFARSGGVILDLAIHDLDWLLWTFGPAQRAYAQTVKVKKDVPIYALGIIKFKSGVLAHVEASWMETPGTFWTAFEICGSGGMIEFDMRNQSALKLSRKKALPEMKSGTIIPEAPCLESPYTTQMKHFIECVRKGKKPLTGIQEANNALNLAMDLIESSTKNKPVEY